MRLMGSAEQARRGIAPCGPAAFTGGIAQEGPGGAPAPYGRRPGRAGDRGCG